MKTSTTYILVRLDTFSVNHYSSNETDPLGSSKLNSDSYTVSSLMIKAQSYQKIAVDNIFKFCRCLKKPKELISK